MNLLVIDVQKEITDNRLYNFQSFIENTARIIDEHDFHQYTKGIRNH